MAWRGAPSGGLPTQSSESDSADATGATTQLVEYDPWGKMTRAEGTAEAAVRPWWRWLAELHCWGRWQERPLVGLWQG